MFGAETDRRLRLTKYLLCVIVGSLLASAGFGQESRDGSSALRATETRAAARNPVLPGDHPDPTVIKVGRTYWMTSTSGNLAPQFTLYRSTDLHHWRPVSAIFASTPGWATGDFWAPELVAERGRTLLYYVARNREGRLCVAGADAPQPRGPYTDHGPLVCQADGSIDPAFARDEAGKPFLIWKEDGNSAHRPTPIWAQALTEDLLHLTDSPTKILVNDPSTWEGNIVEGPFLLRHGGKFYLFYAANSCCSVDCQYAEGVARADHLLGPYTRNPQNPIVRPNGAWRCPGHGDIVESKKGDGSLLYHAFPVRNGMYLGREAVLDPITWGADGWPVVNGAQGPGGGGASGEILAEQPAFRDEFQRLPLDPEWKWTVGNAPALRVERGRLLVSTAASDKPVSLGRQLVAPKFFSLVQVTGDPAAQAGLGVFAGERDGVELALRGGDLELVRVSEGKAEVLSKAAVPAAVPVWMKVSAAGRGEMRFFYSLDRRTWRQVAENIEAGKLVSWERGLRIELIADGPASAQASFAHFSLGGEERNSAGR